jgi:hypothetical protein
MKEIPCNYEGCSNLCCVVIRIEAEKGPDFTGFCKCHILLASHFLKQIAEKEGGQDDSFLRFN